MLNKDFLVNQYLQNMSDFYKDYMVDTELLQTLVTSCMHSVDMLAKYTKDIATNVHLQTAETTRQFPYMAFSANDAMYTLTRIVRTPRINFLLGVPSGLTESELIEYWRYSAPASVKISVLDAMGIYIDLVSGEYYRTIVEGESENIYNADVVNAEVYHDRIKKSPGIHYAIKNNRFYILDIHEFNTDNPQIIMKNITLDYDMSWRRTGSYIGVKYSDVVSRVEYNNLNKLFVRMSSNGPVLKDMKSSILQMFNTEDIKMFDAFSRNNEKFYYWETAATPPLPDGEEVIPDPTEEMVRKGKPLSVFDFVVAMPKDYAHPGISDQDSKVEMFRRYLDVVKPLYAYYYISWMEFIGDDGTGRETIEPIDDNRQKVDSLDDTMDTMEFTDLPLPPCIEDEDDRVSTDYADMFDYSGGIFTDDSVFTWDMDYHEIVEDVEEPKFLEHVSVCMNKFPEAPVGVIAQYNKGTVDVSFQNSGIGATTYEIFRNDVKIKTIPITSQSRDTRVFFSDDRFQNIKTDTYKVRTVYLKEGYQEGLEEYSHFIIVPVKP